ncbi:N-carbamoyl-L-amino-acid hydrolase [Teratosphaeria nubilosa]|uniref:N-carbamoyl-L-amino-acid hydrolase n=1 Tax=Teratosphaeria nubilosa TaxID=161662 RepID=A0A6G1L0V7_9PEZI|nr:N-carbamoyl-L-amino-acid hydrolase [Teratosphaeria nubilosa]
MQRLTRLPGLAAFSPRRGYATVKDLNAPLAQKFKINGDRLWNDIHETAKFSEPNETTAAGGLSRLSATTYDKMARDWFAEQIAALKPTYYGVNATGSQFATFGGLDSSIPPIAMGSHLDSVSTGGRFDGPLGVLGGLEVVRSMKEQGIKTKAPIALINWTNEEGARFFPFLASSAAYAGRSTVDEIQQSQANNGSDETLGDSLKAIGYVGDGPNTFQEFPISAHFEIHVEQARSLEKAGKAIGWVEGWQGINYYEVTFRGEDGHANTYPMYGRRDAMLGTAKLITSLEELAYSNHGYSTVVGLFTGPVGCCNIQSKTKIIFCLMNQQQAALDAMDEHMTANANKIAELYGLDVEVNKTLTLEPGKFWPEAVDCVKRACGDKGMGADTHTAHDSTMTRLLVPTGMVFARGKDGVSHNAKEWTTKEDCAEGVLALGKAVLNFDALKFG